MVVQRMKESVPERQICRISFNWVITQSGNEAFRGLNGGQIAHYPVIVLFYLTAVLSVRNLHRHHHIGYWSSDS